ncbi:MAG: YicC family protein, partial [Bacteroidia bacterium]|nr:YicC family protein [Bacteroidia bacterium]
MLKSMTGFGKSQNENGTKKIAVELRSLNSKSMDLSIRIPLAYREKENELRALLTKKLERGKVDFSVFIESAELENGLQLNKERAKTYHAILKTLSEELNETDQVLLPLVMRMPDLFKTERPEADTEEWEKIMKCAETAVENLNQFRNDEGKALTVEVKNRIENIQRFLKTIEEGDAKRAVSVKERLLKGISEIVEKEKIDENRLEQELIYYLEKMDVTEEKVRLKTHCDYFLETMKEESSGRKLGFISQEIGREINTIGSKANDVTIQKLVVQMKDELEKIKEQLLNVL